MTGGVNIWGLLSATRTKTRPEAQKIDRKCQSLGGALVGHSHTGSVTHRAGLPAGRQKKIDRKCAED